MSAMTTIVTDHFRCQLKSKVLDGHLGAFACVVLHQDESIGDGYIKKEVRNILTEHSALNTTMVVSP